MIAKQKNVPLEDFNCAILNTGDENTVKPPVRKKNVEIILENLDDAISACETETEKQQKAVQQFKRNKKKKGPDF